MQNINITVLGFRQGGRRAGKQKARQPGTQTETKGSQPEGQQYRQGGEEEQWGQ